MLICTQCDSRPPLWAKLWSNKFIQLLKNICCMQFLVIKSDVMGCGREKKTVIFGTDAQKDVTLAAPHSGSDTLPSVIARNIASAAHTDVFHFFSCVFLDGCWQKYKQFNFRARIEPAWVCALSQSPQYWLSHVVYACARSWACFGIHLIWLVPSSCLVFYGREYVFLLKYGTLMSPGTMILIQKPNLNRRSPELR